MIQIHRPAQVPEVLRNRGGKLTAALCAAYNQGIRDFEIQEDVYQHETVKQSLRTAQHDKCCFCESKITHISWGDIEHFRPKKGYRQRLNDLLTRPGYYWLAYAWSNLLFCCQLCNQPHKRNLFPLRRGSTRAVSHHVPLGNERPQFVDPTVEDPGLLIGFREEYPFAVGNNQRGKATIRGLGLERPELTEKRRTHLKSIKQLIDCRSLLIQDVKAAATRHSLPEKAATILKIDALFQEMQEDGAEYAAMARAALQGIEPYP